MDDSPRVFLCCSAIDSECNFSILNLSYRSNSKPSTLSGAVNVRYVAKKTLINVLSNSPSSVASASTSLYNLAAFTKRTRTVSHSK